MKSILLNFEMYNDSIINCRHHVVQISRIYSPRKLKLHTYWKTPHCLHLLAPGNYYCSLWSWAWLFYIPHIDGIMPDLFFWDWLISLCIISFRSIHVFANSRISFFFNADNSLLYVSTIFSLSIYLLVDS